MTTNRPLVCLRCEGSSFAPAEAPVEQEFRGEMLTVVTPVMRCTHCGWETLAPGQLNTLRQRTADAYRKAHGLLTSAEIRERRESLGMSQREFAKALGVGEASVPRWETWQVQEPPYDALIRARTAAFQWGRFEMGQAILNAFCFTTPVEDEQIWNMWFWKGINGLTPEAAELGDPRQVVMDAIANAAPTMKTELGRVIMTTRLADPTAASWLLDTRPAAASIPTPQPTKKRSECDESLTVAA